jgi:protein JSN1
MPSTLDAPLSGDRYGLSGDGVTPTAPTHNRDLSLGRTDLMSRSGGNTPLEPRNFPYARPGLRHSNSSAAALTTVGTPGNGLSGSEAFLSDVNGRLRSGSLTLPENVGGVSNAFGTGFSNTWLQNPAGRSSLHQVTNARGNAKGLHQVVSRESTSSGNSSGGGEDNYAISQSTVDYLGLADNMETPRAATFGFQAAPPAPLPSNGATLTAQRAILDQGPTTPNAAMARHRASTVSVQPKSSASFQDLISAANLGLDRDHTRPVGLFESAAAQRQANLVRSEMEGMEYLDHGRDTSYGSRGNYGFGSAGGAAAMRNDGLLSGLSSLVGSRPRATTISMLDQPSARLGNVGMHGSDLLEGLAMPSMTPPPQHVGANQGGRRSAVSTAGVEERDPSRRRERGESARPGAAGGDGMSAGQTPTRSIWLGNLDVMTTAQDLAQVFMGYGEIESLRLLPEKVSEGDSDAAKIITDLLPCSIVLRFRKLYRSKRCDPRERGRAASNAQPYSQLIRYADPDWIR